MKERPILFKGPMVRAILEGRKTMTRRVVKVDASSWECDGVEPNWPVAENQYGDGERASCPYGQTGDRLWVRETYSVLENGKSVYRADGELRRDGLHEGAWKPSIFMPKGESRITLEVVSVRVERVEDISEEDALAEGTCQPDCPARDCGCNPPYCFGTLWDSINAKRGFSWESNPWVWVVEFKRV